MLLVLLLRHAESTSNVGDDVEDPALTATGVAQADAWRERTASWSLDAILVSPMLRCIATAARARRVQLRQMGGLRRRARALVDS